MINWIIDKTGEVAEHNDIALAHIQRGKPKLNTYADRYTWTGRDKLLGVHVFEDINEVNPLNQTSIVNAKRSAADCLCLAVYDKTPLDNWHSGARSCINTETMS